MSRVDELIAELCPDGVEFRPLSETGTIFGGLTGKSKADFADGNARFASYVNVFNNIALDINADDFVKVGSGERQRALRRGDVLFTGSSETAGEVGMSSVITDEIREPLYLNSFCIGYRLNDPNTLEPNFAKHLFRSSALRKQIILTANGVTRFNISKTRLARVKIPIPPLEVQREIVRILDQFSQREAELEAELEAEVRARTSQYDHWLDASLTFDDRVRSAPMGEVGRFTRGRRFTKKDVVEEGIPGIHYGEIYTHYGIAAFSALSHVRSDIAGRLRFADPGDVIIAAVGETVEDVGKAVAWLGDEKVAIHDDTFLFRHGMNPKFVSYYLRSSQFHEQKNKYVARAKVKRLSGASLAKIMMPVPPRDEQDRIVSVLDNFDVLVNDLSIGLPAELRARRKQYEYYRDRLLTFEEATA